MFYHQINGIILVHDVSNRKSYYNLWNWVSEIIESEGYKEFERTSNLSCMSAVNWNYGGGNWTVSGGGLVNGNNTLNININGNVNGLSSSTFNGHKKNGMYFLKFMDI